MFCCVCLRDLTPLLSCFAIASNVAQSAEPFWQHMYRSAITVAAAAAAALTVTATHANMKSLLQAAALRAARGANPFLHVSLDVVNKQVDELEKKLLDMFFTNTLHLDDSLSFGPPDTRKDSVRSYVGSTGLCSSRLAFATARHSASVIRVDKSTQAVKLVCQTLLHAGPGSHTKKMTTEPNYQ